VRGGKENTKQEEEIEENKGKILVGMRKSVSLDLNNKYVLKKGGFSQFLKQIRVYRVHRANRSYTI
jgi:hypothetical protein